MVTATLKFVGENSLALTAEEVKIYNVGLAYEDAIKLVYNEPYYRVFRSKDPRKSVNWKYATNVYKHLARYGIDPYIFARIAIGQWYDVTHGKFCSLSFLKSDRAMSWYQYFKRSNSPKMGSNDISTIDYVVQISKKLGISESEARQLLGNKI